MGLWVHLFQPRLAQFPCESQRAVALVGVGAHWSGVGRGGAGRRRLRLFWNFHADTSVHARLQARGLAEGAGEGGQTLAPIPPELPPDALPTVATHEVTRALVGPKLHVSLYLLSRILHSGHPDVSRDRRRDVFG